MDKRISIDEAAGAVKSGALIALGGVTLYRRPVGFVKALLKRHRTTERIKDLRLLAFTAGIESDLLVGSGMVSEVRSCYFGLEIFGLAPMFTYLANRSEITITEETEASIATGLRAEMAGVGFMPSHVWLGTDLPRLRPDVKKIVDPYNGEELLAFPAIKPDLAVIHALKADYDGNAQIGKNKGIDEELSITAKVVIVTSEQVVPGLESVDLVAPTVDAVVEIPGGALPTSCHPLYPMDGERILEYTRLVSDPASFEKYLETFLAD